MDKFTAVYPRVSTKIQVANGTSLDYQEEVCINKAKEFGAPDHLIKVYREEGFSGEDIDRPAMNQLRDDVKNGSIGRIVILHPDRLSREMVDRLIVCSEFEKYGVDLVFVDTEYKDTEEGKLFFNIQSSIAQYELALIKKRTSRGVISAVKKGKVMPMRVPPYGYDLVDSQLVINKEEAKFVKKVFQWYVYDKLTMREIGEKLYYLGAKPKRKESLNWSASSLSRILKGEVYIGRYYYNRRKTKKIKGEKTAAGNAKKSYEFRDKEEWLLIEVPPIVDPATFQLAQDTREKNTKHSGNIKYEYLLRKIIRCGHCGNKYSSYTTTYKQTSKKTGKESKWTYRKYRCTNRNTRKFGENVENCSSEILNADEIESHIWDDLIAQTLQNTDELVAELEKKNKKPNKEIEETYNLLKYKMLKMDEEKKRIIKLFKKSYIDEDEMEVDMNKVNNAIKDLKKEMSKYEKQMFDIGKHEVSLEMIKKLAEEVKNIIGDNKNVPFKTKRTLVEWLIDEIVIKHEDGNIKVSVVGDIEQLVNGLPSELSTQQESIINTTNRVKIYYEALLQLASINKRENKMRVLDSKLLIS